jgi:hypothetical protein
LNNNLVMQITVIINTQFCGLLVTQSTALDLQPVISRELIYLLFAELVHKIYCNSLPYAVLSS